MTTLAVTQLAVELSAEPIARATMRLPEETVDLWYRASRGPISSAADPWWPVALVPAMKLGLDVRCDGSVSPKLLMAGGGVQDIFCGWNPSLRRIGVRAVSINGEPESAESANGVGCFFSGGVDSFYTVLSHYEEITSLIFVHGFDIALERQALDARVTQAVRAAAAELGKPLIEVWTNLRVFTNRYADWGFEMHGAALAGVALLLAPQLRKVYLPSSHTMPDLSPWGSHPLLDPLWSNEGCSLIHDGFEATRFEKVERLASSEIALRFLRVCWKNPEDAYNCSRCEKCLRTMISLKIIGMLERCPAFDRPLDLGAVARLPLSDKNLAVYAKEHIQTLRARGGDKDLLAALQDALDGAQHPWGLLGWIRRAARAVARTTSRVMSS